MVGSEPDIPYERPPLSKDYLTGQRAFEQMHIRPREFYEAREIGMLLGATATGVDPDRRRVSLEDGTSIDYGSLVWATGGAPRKLDTPGRDLRGVHTIRTRADIDRLRSALPHVRDVVVIGGGFIGLEAAAALRQLDKHVTLIEMEDQVLARVAAEPLARFLEAEHRSRGVLVRLGAQVECIEHVSGRLSAVHLSAGQRLAADAVIVGIGIVPETGALARAGAAASNGIDVDEYCRTSLPCVFAVGDVARRRSEHAAGHWVRLESVHNAADQAATVARCLTGMPSTGAAVPWFWSDQYDLKLQTIGLNHGYDEVIVRGDTARRSFSVVYLRRKTVIALDCVNAPRDYAQGKALVASRARPDPALLADASRPLKGFAA